jgi:hypothetical protein
VTTDDHNVVGHNYYVRITSLKQPKWLGPGEKDYNLGWSGYSANFTLTGLAGNIPNGGVCPLLSGADGSVVDAAASRAIRK